MAKIQLTSFNKKIAVGLAAALLLLIVAGVVAWIRLSAPTPEVITKNATEVDFAQVFAKAQMVSNDYLKEGNTDKGLEYYDEQITLRRSNSEKKKLLALKSGFAVKAGKFDVGVDSAKKANDLGSDAVTTRALAEAYEAAGDKQKAVVYYKELLELQEEESKKRGDNAPVGRPSSLSPAAKIEELEQ